MTEALPLPAKGTRIDLAREPDFILGERLVSPSTLEVKSGEHREVLQKRVMQVLVALARRPGEVVSRDELIESCWDGLAISDDAINRCIGRLRRMAGLGHQQGLAIETIPRVGYRLTVAPGEAGSALGVSAAGGLAPPSARRPPPHARLPMIAVAAAAALMLAAAGFWRLSGNGAIPPVDTSVAVTSPQVLSSDPDVRFFAQGVMNRIVALLGATDIKALKADGPRRPRAKLVVGASVEGDGAELRVLVHIDDGRTGATLWSQQFSRGRSEAGALQSQAAAKTADAIAFSLLCLPTRAGESDTASLCARGAQLLRESAFPNARILLEELTSKAPDFAFGHILLASAALGEKAIAQGDRRRALNTEAHDEAQRALALDPTLADGHRILAATLPTRAWAAREAEFRKAIALGGKASALSQSNADAGLARLLLDAGRASEAADLIQRATALDPLSAGKVTITAATLEATDRLGEAKDVLRSGVRIWPDDFAVRLYQRYFVLTYGSREEATAVLQESVRLFPLQPSALEALRRFSVARASNDPSLRATAARTLTDAANARAIDRRLAVSALSALGDANAAFAQADVLFSDQFAETTSLFVPATASMRRDPRFMALANRVGLVGYWRQSGKWPDFCAGSVAPYDCAAVARGLVR